MPRKACTSAAVPDKKKPRKRELSPARESRDRPKAESDAQRAARINHSEVEKRRRNSLNNFIYELAMLLPLNPGVQLKKLDKLSILRLSVEYFRCLPRSLASGQFSHVPVESLDDFVRVIASMDDVITVAVDCRNEKCVYGSRSACFLMGTTETDICNSFLSDILHPDDLRSTRKQIQSRLTRPAEIAEEMKPFNSTFLPQDTSALPIFCSFTCRIKCATPAKPSSSSLPQFLSARCSGVIKTLAALSNVVQTALYYKPPDGVKGPDSVLFFVAKMADRSNRSDYSELSTGKFACRLSPDAKFIAVDDQFDASTGHPSSAVLGVSVYRFCHPGDLWRMAECHRWVLAHPGECISHPCRLLNSTGCSLTFVAQWQSVAGPSGNGIDHILWENTLTL